MFYQHGNYVKTKPNHQMKSTIRISIIVFFLAVVSALNAQTFKLEIGYANPKIHGNDTSSTYLNGIRVGGTVELKLKKNFTLLSGALYNLVYSNKLQGYRDDQAVNYITMGQSVDIPLRLVYSYSLNKNLKAFVFGGPNLNIGLKSIRGITSTLDSANIKYTGITSKTQNLYTGSILNRMNLQIGLGGGVQWKKYLIKSGYDFGLVNMNHISTKKLYEGGWYISLGYEF